MSTQKLPTFHVGNRVRFKVGRFLVEGDIVALTDANSNPRQSARFTEQVTADIDSDGQPHRRRVSLLTLVTTEGA